MLTMHEELPRRATRDGDQHRVEQCTAFGFAREFMDEARAGVHRSPKRADTNASVIDASRDADARGTRRRSVQNGRSWAALSTCSRNRSACAISSFSWRNKRSRSVRGYPSGKVNRRNAIHSRVWTPCDATLSLARAMLTVHSTCLTPSPSLLVLGAICSPRFRGLASLFG